MTAMLMSWWRFHTGGLLPPPSLRRSSFAFVLISYLLTLVGNTAIILISLSWIPCSTHPCIIFLPHLLADLCLTTQHRSPTAMELSCGPYTDHQFYRLCHSTYVSLALGSTECVLPAVMAFDRLCCCLHGHPLCQLCTHDWPCRMQGAGVEGQHPNSEHHHLRCSRCGTTGLPLHL